MPWRSRQCRTVNTRAKRQNDIVKTVIKVTKSETPNTPEVCPGAGGGGKSRDGSGRNGGRGGGRNGGGRDGGVTGEGRDGGITGEGRDGGGGDGCGGGGGSGGGGAYSTWTRTLGKAITKL